MTVRNISFDENGNKIVTEYTDAEWEAIAPQPRVAEQRAEAVLDKTSFCKRLRQVGILPATEAVLAARGEWPATFAAFTSGMTEDDAADAQIEWAGALNIHYNHPLLQGLALAYANGDPDGATAVLDLIYGLS